MNNIKLLDCTLRDGGFLNDWHFGKESILQIATGLVAAGVDMIEVGFLDARRTADPARSIFPDTASVRATLGNFSRGESLLLGMIDFGTCDLSHIEPADRSVLDGIRVIFKKEQRAPALNFCASLKELGYRVYAQPVSVTSYTAAELSDLLALVRRTAPDTVSIVDTYGLLQRDMLLRYYSLFDEALPPEIGIGFHAHNNLQLAFANCLAVLAAHERVGSGRTLTLDGSIFGMGKSAGNAPLELLLHHLACNAGGNYDLLPVLSLIERHILPLYGEARWGYRLPYFLAAANACHPSYVFYLLNELSLDAPTAHTLLSSLDREKRLTFDRAHIEALYQKSAARERAGSVGGAR